MNPPPAEEKKPGKISQFFARIFSGPRRLMQAALPVRAAVFTAFFLLLIVLTVWTIVLVNPDSVPWRHSMTVGRVLAIICLLAVIPLVVYQGLKLWLEGDRSYFEDIDFAWNAGLAALARGGLDIRSLPVFLVIGSSDEAQEAALFDATGLSFRVRGVPEGPAALHWYANPDAIFLCCTQAGWLSTLAQLEQKHDAEALAARLPDPEGPSMRGYAPTGAPGPAAPLAPVEAAGPAPKARHVGTASDPNRGTIMLDQYMAAQQAAAPPPLVAAEPSQKLGDGPALKSGGKPEDSNRGTMMLQAPLASLLQASATSSAPATISPARGELRPASLSPQDAAEQMERLQYICQLLKLARQPLCPANGMLTLLSFSIIESANGPVEELERAVRSDLLTIQRQMQLRCPVTALVTGMERESGFLELVRRVGRERAATQRFGRSFDVRSVASPDELANLNEHVCGAFEDWVYTLFREKGALSRPGNTRLYALLCKVRCTLKGRLAEVLTAGFGITPGQSRGDSPLMFSGCYFAATGESDDRQAFVHGVFEKLIKEQESLEWTHQALENDQRYLWATYLAIAIDVGLVATLGGMILYRVFFRK